MQPGPGGAMPPQGAPAPQAPAPQGPPHGQSGGGAEQLVSQIHSGINGLKPMLGGADPQLKHAFMGLDGAFQAFVAEAGKPQGQPAAPAAPVGPKPPMPSHAGPGSQPMPPGA